MKGSNLTNWNWQAAETESGISLNQEDGDKNAAEFELDKEIERADEDLAIEEANILSANVHH